MANQLQDSVLAAIDTLVSNRIENLKTDKTVIATIEKCTDARTNEYRVTYNGGTMYAYALGTDQYAANQTVYVQVPLGDFSQRKTIVSRVQTKQDDQNITFVSSAISDYNKIGGNIVINDTSKQPIGLRSYLKETWLEIYSADNDPQDNIVDINISELNNTIKEAEAIMVEASFLTRLPKEHRNSQTGIYGLAFKLAFQDGDKYDENGLPIEVYRDYVIDVNNMTGNPYKYAEYSEQYEIFPIDEKKFLRIDHIMAYCKDFVTVSNGPQAELWGDDIFIKDIEFYPLGSISAVQDDYKLTLSTPLGSTFTTTLAKDELSLVAQLMKGDVTNLSDATTFYWAVKDNRVTSSSDNYHMYCGNGWKWLRDKGANYKIGITANENRAYENQYLCVAVYKEQIILKIQATIYNNACKNTIELSSNMGTRFSYDRGTPTVTCLVNGHENNFEEGNLAHSDSMFTFVWSTKDANGQHNTYLKTAEELQQEYDALIKTGNYTYSTLTAVANQRDIVGQIDFPKGLFGNQMTYPVRQIDMNSTVSCSVYLKDTADGEEYNIGTAELVLTNDNNVSPDDCYIVIENGDQVFQYSESGVSPAHERYGDPQIVKPLICHFYDQAGIEIDNHTYQVRWQFPLENSLIIPPTVGITQNYANGKFEWYGPQTQLIYPLQIEDNYDYSATLNQIICIVDYSDNKYTKETNFTFKKQGDNGTNGTDIVTKITPINVVNGFQETATQELPAVEYVGTTFGDTARRYNYGHNADAYFWNFKVYNRNEEIQIPGNVVWKLYGGTSNTYKSKYFSAPTNNGVNQVLAKLNYNDLDTIERGKTTNLIIQASTTIEGQQYYGYYPVPIVRYLGTNIYNTYRLSIDDEYTMKSILYNADGRNPMYNENQGIRFRLRKATGIQPYDDTANMWFRVSVQGGVDDTVGECNFSLRETKDSKSVNVIQSELDVNEFFAYVYPDDIYSGEYSNNVIHIEIFNDTELEIEAYVPIFMSLNQYGLTSLNAWDGTHVEINENENYILAPQIGAGEKNNQNQFTGIVMGTQKEYGQSDSTIGLFGFANGEQSIFLNAVDGSATFGLPKENKTSNDSAVEGRIQLVPGGISQIGKWNIGGNSLFSIPNLPIGNNPNENDRPYFITSTVNGRTVTRLNPDAIPAYKDKYKVPGAQIGVPHDQAGMILNSDPAYMSIKSVPLYDEAGNPGENINWNHAQLTIQQGDSFEVEIDPQKMSAFTIYRHHHKDDDPHKEWTRSPLVGINAAGKFYSNALRDDESSMNIGWIGAFNKTAANHAYIGANFAYGSTEDTILKFFVPYNDGVTKTSTVALSGGTDKTNEYERDMNLYGNAITLYAKADTAYSDTSDNKISISRDAIDAGTTFTRLYLADSANTGSEIKAPGGITINSIYGDTYKPFRVNGSVLTLNGSGALAVNSTTATYTHKGDTTYSITGAETHTMSGNYSITATDRGVLTMNTTSTTLKANASYVDLKRNPNTAANATKFYSNGHMDIQANDTMTIRTHVQGGAIAIKCQEDTGARINLYHNGFSLNGGTGGGRVYSNGSSTVVIQNHLGVNGAADTNYALKINGATYSTGEIKSSGSIYALGAANVSGNDFYYNNNWQCSGGNQGTSSRSIMSHIDGLAHNSVNWMNGFASYCQTAQGTWNGGWDAAKKVRTDSYNAGYNAGKADGEAAGRTAGYNSAIQGLKDSGNIEGRSTVYIRRESDANPGTYEGEMVLRDGTKLSQGNYIVSRVVFNG